MSHVSELVMEVEEVVRELQKMDRERSTVKSAALSAPVKAKLLEQLDEKIKAFEARLAGAGIASAPARK